MSETSAVANSGISAAAQPTESIDGLACSVPVAAKELGVGVSSVWKLIREKRIRTIKLFNRRLIPRDELRRIVTEAA